MPPPGSPRRTRTGGRRRSTRASGLRSQGGRPGSTGAAAGSRNRTPPAMTGPIPSFVPGNRSRTASARTCAAEWRIGPSSSPAAPWSISSVALPRSATSGSASSSSCCSSSDMLDLSSGITKPLVHCQDERFTPAVPPSFARHPLARSARASLALCRDIGRRPGRFAGRSRVVGRRVDVPGLQPGPGSLGRLRRRRVSRSARYSSPVPGHTRHRVMVVESVDVDGERDPGLEVDGFEFVVGAQGVRAGRSGRMTM